MKHLKMLGFAAAAAAILMVFAAPAAATTLTSPKGTAYTGTFDASTNFIALDGTFVSAKCNLGEFRGTVESHGAGPVKITLSGGGYALCGFQHYVLKRGTLEVHTDGASEDGNGTVTSTGMEITLNSSVGHCVFTSSSTYMGTITGSDTGNAVWDTDSATIPKTGGSFLCGASATLTGSFTITTPSTLSVD
jgi:hypothetical protein